MVRSRLLFVGAVVMVGAVALAWMTWRDPRISFLPNDRDAEWILFPSAVEVRAHSAAKLDAIFRREFSIDRPVPDATLTVRAATSADIKINGSRVELTSTGNWKDRRSAEVATQLRAGTNVIEARVFHANGPPALWLALRGAGQTLRTDASWQTSFAGSAWRAAAVSTAPRIPGPGNLIFGGETTFGSLRNIWRTWLLFALAAGAIVTAAFKWRRYFPAHASGLTRLETTILITAASAAWLLLFWHNARLLPFDIGFDSQSHLDYIRYLQEHHVLPWPNQGVQMFQPPLFYLISANVLSACGLVTTQPSGILVLRLLTTLFGIAHFIIVFATMRLLWPRDPGRQIVGLLLAAFLPMNLYMSHFCTNETLVALLIGAAVYQCVRILQRERGGWIPFALLGLTLGAAALTKFTAVLAMPFIIAAIAVRLRADRRPPMEWLAKPGGIIAIAALVSGWHYVRLARGMGTFVIGGWDPAIGLAWWQEDGYRVARYFTRFGEALARPFFSASGSFADGIYSTLWGDGLCAGVPALQSRVPWNYELMSAGYLLSLIPMMLITVGAAIAVVRWLRGGGLPEFVLAGLASATLCGLILINLRVPSYASVKAFYGLAALSSLAFFAAIGWRVMTRDRRTLQFALTAILLAWAMNSFASLWIRDSAALHVYAGLRNSEHDAASAVTELRAAVTIDPHNPRAQQFLSWVLGESGAGEEALQHAKQALGIAPDDAAAHLQLGSVLVRTGDLQRATGEIQHAIKLGPENWTAYNLLAFCLLQSGATANAITAARDGLAISPFSPELHYVLGAALAQNSEFLQATNQLAYVLLLRPKAAEVRSAMKIALTSSLSRPGALQEFESTAPESSALLSDLAWIFATHPEEPFRDGAKAVQLAEHASTLAKNDDAEIAKSLAAAYAEVGRFDEAIAAAERAATLARSAGASDVAFVADEMVSVFRDHHPFREEPRP